jgi:hypothetical protein
MQQSFVNLLMGSAGVLALSAAARALPEPANLGSRFYACFYQLTQFLLANFDKVPIGDDVQSRSYRFDQGV